MAGQPDSLQILLVELSKVGNYSVLLRKPEFWKLFYAVTDKNLKDQLYSSIAGFFRCPICGVRRASYKDDELVCLNCDGNSSDPEVRQFVAQGKLECLKCFRPIHSYFFSASNCYHLCSFCISKEVAKGRSHCKICRIGLYDHSVQYNCNACSNNFPINQIFVLKCSHVYCSACIGTVKSQKKCSGCPNSNLQNSELYDINTRSQEMCLECQSNFPIPDFRNKTCCDSDICELCLSSCFKNSCICGSA